MDLFIRDVQCHNAMTPIKNNKEINECTHEHTQQTSGGIMCLCCGVVVVVRLQIDQTLPQQSQNNSNTRKRNYILKNRQNNAVNPFEIFQPKFRLPVSILTQVRQLYHKICNDDALLTLLRIDRTVFVCGVKAKAFIFVLIIKCCRLSLVNHTLETEQRWLKQSGIPRKFAGRFFHVYEIWQSNVHNHLLRHGEKVGRRGSTRESGETTCNTMSRCTSQLM